MSEPTRFGRLERAFHALRHLNDQERVEKLSALEHEEPDLISELRRLLDVEDGTAFVDSQGW
ncbi:MAG: hypothetical protein KDB53_10655, partial [Planctomycetes bacterium]|nr:hypothetical protein [Planctomycetota bacterium]